MCVFSSVHIVCIWCRPFMQVAFCSECVCACVIVYVVSVYVRVCACALFRDHCFFEYIVVIISI